MADIIKFDIKFNEKDFFGAKIESLINDRSMTAIHQTFAKIISPWIPMDEGILAGSVRVAKNYVEYKGPYAHYQYMGEIYGPNYPGWEAPGAPGWRSPDKKHPTGRELGKQSVAMLTPKWKINSNGDYTRANHTDEMIEWEFGYNKQHHPLATHHWDKVAMKTELPRFEKEAKEILLRERK